MNVEASLNLIKDRLGELKVFSSSISISLPHSQLLTFSGSPTEWTPFCDLFYVSVYDKWDLSDIQKLSKLKGQLEDPAKTFVEHFSLEAANYWQCVDILKTTNCKSDVGKASLIQALVGLSTPGFNIETLAEFRAAFECHIRSFNR